MLKQHRDSTTVRLGHFIVQIQSFLAGALLLAIVLLTVADVIGRNVFGTSILGAVEVTTLMLVAAAFLGLAVAEIDDRHVSVDLVVGRAGKKFQLIANGIVFAVFVIAGAVLTYGLIEAVESAAARGELTNGVMRLSTWPVKAVLLVAFVTFFLSALTRLVARHRHIKAGQPEQEEQKHHVGI